MSQGEDGVGDADTAREKSALITSYIQLDEYHNALHYMENAMEAIYSKYKFTPYKYE